MEWQCASYFDETSWLIGDYDIKAINASRIKEKLPKAKYKLLIDLLINDGYAGRRRWYTWLIFAFFVCVLIFCCYIYREEIREFICRYIRFEKSVDDLADTSNKPNDLKDDDKDLYN